MALGVAVPGKLARLQQFPAVRARPIDTAELAERLPVLAPFDGPAMFDPDGGAIRTRAAIAALRDRLLRPMVAEQVLSIDHTGAEVEVRSATGCARFRRVVVCAGRGTAALAAGVGVSIPAAVSAHARVSFAVRADAPVRLAGLQDGGAFLADTATYATAYPDRRTYALGVGSAVPLAGDGIGLRRPGHRSFGGSGLAIRGHGSARSRSGSGGLRALLGHRAAVERRRDRNLAGGRGVPGGRQQHVQARTGARCGARGLRVG